jgi:hypothetical protein
MADITALHCPICSRPVLLTNCKTDEEGRAVHEECYLKKIAQGGKRGETQEKGRSHMRRLA